MPTYPLQFHMHPKNGMVPCPNCHTFFDDMLNPEWIFVPSNLDYFINYELENCKTCQNLQDCTVPDCHEYLSYQIIIRIQSSNATMPLYTKYKLGSEQWPPHPSVGTRSGTATHLL